MSKATAIKSETSVRGFKKYPAYKDSGVEWLGEVPKQWNAVRFKYLLSEPLKYGANEVAELDDPALPRYVRITDVNEDGTLREDTFKSLPEDIATPYLLKDGDLLFARSGATVGKTFYYQDSWGRAAYAGYLIRGRLASNKMIAKFAAYFAQSTNYWGWLGSSVIQATIQNVSAEKYAGLVLGIPSSGEQHAIVKFLDRETARIDLLIARKERQIELLQEKRSALISHAVTKGLNPKAKMKDSGIEWLGEIPEHWEIRKIKYAAFIRGGQVDPRNQKFDDMLFVAPNHIESRTGRLLASETTEEQGAISGKYMFQKGDVLYSKIRPALAKACIAPEDGLCSADMYAMLPMARNNSKYLLYILVSDAYTKLAVDESMRVAMPKINREDLGSIRWPLPPEDEQLNISEQIELKTIPIDKLTEKIISSVDRLREYRTALISAAVTGKIDVREEAV